MPALVSSSEDSGSEGSGGEGSVDTNFSLADLAHPDQDGATTRMHAAVLNLALAFAENEAQHAALVDLRVELHRLQVETDQAHVERLRQIRFEVLERLRLRYLLAPAEVPGLPRIPLMTLMSAEATAFMQALDTRYP